MKKFAIAIDGPNGAGKSTVARALAAKLGCVYVDTGALYRAIGLYAARTETDPDDAAAVTALLDDISVDLAYAEDGQRVLLNGEDVSGLIRTPQASVYASKAYCPSFSKKFIFIIEISSYRRFPSSSTGILKNTVDEST